MGRWDDQFDGFGGGGIAMKMELIGVMAGQKISFFFLMSIIETHCIESMEKWHIIRIK